MTRLVAPTLAVLITVAQAASADGVRYFRNVTDFGVFRIAYGFAEIHDSGLVNFNVKYSNGRCVDGDNFISGFVLYDTDDRIIFAHTLSAPVNATFCFVANEERRVVEVQLTPEQALDVTSVGGVHGVWNRGRDKGAVKAYEKALAAIGVGANGYHCNEVEETCEGGTEISLLLLMLGFRPNFIKAVDNFDSKGHYLTDVLSTHIARMETYNPICNGYPKEENLDHGLCQ